MRIFRLFAFAFGLVGLAAIGLPGDVFASADTPAAKQLDKAEAAKIASETRGLLMPYIDPAKGRSLYASKGCVVCHAINGIGGTDAPSLVTKNMPAIMNPFEFAAKMWAGAGTMISMQEDELGEQIEFDGNELINIIAFVHDAQERAKFSQKDIPMRIEKLMGHLGTETGEHETIEHKAGD